MTSGAHIMIMTRLIGRKDIHVRFMRRSYRIRGRVARALRNRQASSVVFIMVATDADSRWMMDWVIRILVRRAMKIMFMYSAMKMKANEKPAYSVLKPDTSSLSPSAKSNGVRFVSASRVVNQMKPNMGEMIMGLYMVDSMSWRLNVEWKSRIEIRISAILTSYEMVWATLRKAPNSAYLELEAHPLPMVEYTLSLEMHRNMMMPNVRKKAGEEEGAITHRASAKERFSIGVYRNRELFDMKG